MCTRSPSERTPLTLQVRAHYNNAVGASQRRQYIVSDLRAIRVHPGGLYPTQFCVRIPGTRIPNHEPELALRLFPHGANIHSDRLINWS